MEAELIIRFLSAFFAGAFLCIGGSLVQVFTQNEIASPSTLGLDGLAVLQVITFHLIRTFLGVDFSLELGSVLLTIFPLLFLLKIDSSKTTDFEKKTNQFILLGVCFNLFVGAIFSLLYFLFLTKSVEFPSHLWFGSFKHTSPESLIIMGTLFTIIWASLFKFSKKLQFLVYGPDFCLNLKLPIHSFTKPVVAISYLSVAVTTCFYGVFSFLGLLFPHILRAIPIFARNTRLELTLGPILCGVIFALIDALTYQLPFFGAEIPVGMISSVLGSLIFVILMIRKTSFSR